MNRTEQQFFSLLRSGLWNGPIDVTLFSAPVDWRAILNIAAMQTVSGVVSDGISNLPSDIQPPVPVMRRLYQTVIRIEQSHELLNRQLTEIVARLQSEGIAPVLLKGQGVAQYYPNPVRRQCGDIDLYIGHKDYKKACELAVRWGIVSPGDIESHKHYHFRWNGVAIEFHRIAERLRNPVRNKYFQRWTVFHLLDGNMHRTWNLDHTEIRLPPVNLDALYIFSHAYHHFTFGGVGFRQLCDWALFLSAFSNQINREELYHDLKSFGLLRGWQIFGYIAVHYLGLAEEQFPFFSGKHHKISQEIISKHILHTGNFGLYDPDREERPAGYLAGKLHTFKNQSRRVGRLFSLAPADMALYYANFLTIGLRQIIKDKLKPFT